MDAPPALPDLDTPDPDDLPPMGYREASWHTHVAAVRATPSTADATAEARALAAAASGCITVCGVSFAPISAGSLIAIQSAARLAEEAGRSIDGADEVALLVYCLADGQTAFRLAEAGAYLELVTAARRLLAPVPLSDLPALTAWCMDTMAKATGRPQKKTGE